jgi:hypothetical protein
MLSFCRSEAALGKYDPLRDHLQAIRSHTWIATFREIEDVIADQLPSSAYHHQAWWSNSRSHIQTCSWLDAGWQTERLDLERKRIVFRKHCFEYAMMSTRSKRSSVVSIRTIGA